MKWPCTAAAVAVVALRLAILPWLPVPEPRAHDEFGYLLGAETFAAGRMTNPVHPMWRHFETMHVNMRPTYQMKYPPAQSMALAAGQLAFGHPWAGVLATGAAMAAAVCWMLLAWLPVRWAFGATLALMIKVGVLGYWMNSYWGGAIAAAAGALVMGACARLIRDPKPGLAACLGLGTVVLANSRPFEGSVLCLIVGGVTIAWIRRDAWPRVIAPAAGIVALGVGVMAIYNTRVTGHASVMPYQEHQRQYAAAPVMLLQADVKAPEYRHEALRKFWEWDRSFYLSAVENPGFSVMSLLLEAMPFFLSIPLAPAFLWGLWKQPKLGGLLGLFLAALCFERWLQPHYLAPAAGVITLLTAIGFRAMDRRLALALAIAAIGLKAWTWKPKYFTGYDVAFVAERQRVTGELSRIAGKDLVLVRYSPRHSVFDEWVYNRADIDSSDIVWAREMSPADDREIVAHFRNRKAWILDADAAPARLIPYEPRPESASPTAAD